MISTEKIRTNILSMALTGNLTCRLKSDDSPTELKDLIKNRIMPFKRTETGFISDWFTLIPEQWETISIGSSCINIEYGTSKKSDKVGLIPVLRMGNLVNGHIDYSDLVFSSNSSDNSKYDLKENDLLFNRTNSADKVGKTAIYKGEKKAIFAGYLIRITPVGVYPDYLNYVMQSSFFKEYCNFVKTDSVDQSNINSEKLKNFEYALPSLAEQIRIAKLIDSIFAILDEIDINQNLYALNAKLLYKKLRNLGLSGHLTNSKHKEWEKVTFKNVIKQTVSLERRIQSFDIKNDGNIPVVSQSEKIIDGFCCYQDKIVTDIPLVVFGDHNRAVKLIDFNFVAAGDGAKFIKSEKCTPKFLFYLTEELASKIKSKGYARHYSDLCKQEVLIPPIHEQKIILQKMESLLELCNEF